LVNPIETDVPNPEAETVALLKTGTHTEAEITGLLEKSDTVYFAPGLHYIEDCTLRVPSGKNIYIAGGAVVVGSFIIDRAKNVRIYGRGVVNLYNFERFNMLRPFKITYSENITVDGITAIDSCHYTVYLGQSENVRLNNLKMFSCYGWCDGVDMMSCKNVEISNCFIRTSDDCIAVYGHRWGFFGDTENITVTGCTLWSDVAHPLCIGVHGHYEENGNTISGIVFKNIDILEHNETCDRYWGCMALNVGDKNTVRDVICENVRVERFTLGRLFDVRVWQNADHNPFPGNGIENLLFKNITCEDAGENPSIIDGCAPQRTVRNVTFENVVIAGKHVVNPTEHNITVGGFTENIKFV
jgi:polygalacturonase